MFGGLTRTERESILSRHIARKTIQAATKFLEEPQQTPFWYTYTSGKRWNTLTLRHCYRGSYSTGEPNFTGGIVFKATRKGDYEHTNNRLEITGRLRPGWTPEQLTKALSKALMKLDEEKWLYDMREGLYQKADQKARNLDPADLDRIIDEAEKKGITATYDQMGTEALDYWNRLFE